MSKKLPLLAILGLINFNSLYAQTRISFENSEGFVLGDINGQNNWEVANDGAGNFISNQEISAALASNGTQSLKIDEDATFGPQNSLVMGAYYGFPNALNSTHYSISADINFDYTAGTDESAFMISIDGGVNFISQIIFDYTGELYVTTVKGGTGTYELISNKIWTGNRWYNVKIEVDGSQVKYYLDNTLQYTGVVLANEQFLNMRFTHDNWGGGAYIDNIVVTDHSLAGTKNTEFFTENFTLYPNPTTDVINISSKNGLEMKEIKITDLSGKVIKVQKETSTVNVSDLAVGTYLIDITTKEGKATSKFIKK